MKNHKDREWRERNTECYDRSVLYENPCLPDCPDRNGECHAKCEKYKKFAEGRQKLYEEKKRLNALYAVKR